LLTLLRKVIKGGGMSRLKYKNKAPYRPLPDLFAPKELVNGVFLYSHKIVGVMHPSNIFPGIKRYKIIRAFMEQGGQYYVPPRFSHLRNFEEIRRYEDIISGNIKDFSAGISSYIKITTEANNRFDRNALSIHLNSSFCYSLNNLKLMGVGPNVFLDVGYLPKEHKNEILNGYAEHHLVGIKPDKRSFVVELVLYRQSSERTKANHGLMASKAEELQVFKDISNMSLRKIRSSLEVD